MSGAPIAILGGGPVGMTLALLLARRHVPALVLDARSIEDAKRDRRLLALSRGTLDTLDAVVDLPAGALAPIRSVVVSSRGEFGRAVLDEQVKPRKYVVLRMLDDAVAALTGKQGTDGWKSFLKPSDVVGIKTNAWSYIPTTAALESALEQRVRDVGVKAQDVAIDDRGVALPLPDLSGRLTFIFPSTLGRHT